MLLGDHLFQNGEYDQAEAVYLRVIQKAATLHDNKTRDKITDALEKIYDKRAELRRDAEQKLNNKKQTAMSDAMKKGDTLLAAGDLDGAQKAYLDARNLSDNIADRTQTSAALDKVSEFRQEDYQRLEEIFPHINFQSQPSNLECNADIKVWQGLAVNFFDNLTINYTPNLRGTNAFIVDSEKNLCCVFNLEERINDKNFLYLRKNRDFPCRESQVKNYFLILMERVYSEQFFNFYNGKIDLVQENIPAYSLQLLNFKVYEPEILKMPVAIDFGTSSTTAGVLDFKEKSGVAKLHNSKIKHAIFYDTEGNAVHLLPTIIGVQSLENPTQPEYVFGYDAFKLSEYIDEGFTIFYDVKRWISNFDKEEELTDNLGRRVKIFA